MHMLYGGTTIMQHNSPVQEGGALTAPDGGCICYCVRTGFSSSEGKLVRCVCGRACAYVCACVCACVRAYAYACKHAAARKGAIQI